MRKPTRPSRAGWSFLKAHGGSGSSWASGTFGLLDANFDPDLDCNGGSNRRELSGAARWAGSTAITRCFSGGRCGIRPGSMTGPVSAGLDTRFDMYMGNLKNEKNNEAYAPAPNVVKGVGPQRRRDCIQNSNDVQALHRLRWPCRAKHVRRRACDSEHRFGDGNWDKAGYIAKNHRRRPHRTATRAGRSIRARSRTRPRSRVLPSPQTETGRPTCSNEGPAGPERRVLIVAVMNCGELGGNTEAVPGKYIRVFLTEPSATDVDGEEKNGSSNGEIWVEEIEEVTRSAAAPGGGGFIHDVVQLYR